MSDAAIVGIVGIVVSGVLGPLIAYHIQKDRQSYEDKRNLLDDAVVAASSFVASLSKARDAVVRFQGVPMHSPGDQEIVGSAVASLVDGLQQTNAVNNRLQLRFGKEDKLFL